MSHFIDSLSLGNAHAGDGGPAWALRVRARGTEDVPELAAGASHEVQADLEAMIPYQPALRLSLWLKAIEAWIEDDTAKCRQKLRLAHEPVQRMRRVAEKAVVLIRVELERRARPVLDGDPAVETSTNPIEGASS